MNTVKCVFALLVICCTATIAKPIDDVGSGHDTVIQLSKNPEARAADFARIRKIMRSAPVTSGSKKGAVTSFGECGEFTDTPFDCGGNLVVEWGMSEFGVTTLKRVVITGSAACQISITGSWTTGGTMTCDDVYSFLNQNYPPPIDKRTVLGDTAEVLGSIAEAVASVAEVATSIIDTISPLLPKCAPTPMEGSPKNPDQDRDLLGWQAAQESIVLAYAGNLQSLRVGARVDVLYPSNWVQRFIISDFVPEPQKLATAPTSLRLLPLSTPPADQTPCKPH